MNEQREIEDDRGKTLVLSAAVAVIVINTLATFSALFEGSGVAFSLLHALRLAWVFVVAYCLSEGESWARWLSVVWLVTGSVLGLIALSSPKSSPTASSIGVLIALLLLRVFCLFILLLSDSAVAFFKRAAPSS